MSAPVTRPATLGASSVGAILGLSPFASAWKVWAELRGILPREDVQTGPMWLGTVLEDHIRERWAAEQGVQVAPGLKIEDAPIYPTDETPAWRHARPDGFIDLGIEPGSARFDLVEIKAVLFSESPEWGEDGTDQIPLYYQPQIVHQADVVECSENYGLVRGTHVIACDRARGDLRTYWIPHDRERARRMRAVLRDWYVEHIENGTQPDPDASEACRLAAAALYMRPAKTWTTPTDDDRRAVADLIELRAHRDAVDTACATIENRLRLRIASDAGLAGLVSWTHRGRKGQPAAGRLTIWNNADTTPRNDDV